MLTVKGITYGRQNNIAAIAPATAALGAAAPKEGSSERGLLKTMIMAAASDPDTFDVEDLAEAFRQVLSEIPGKALATQDARDWCRQQAATGTATAERLAGQANGQGRTLADLARQDTVVITRGTNPVQARAILTHCTFGGLPAVPDLTAPPTARDAVAQTGFAEKNTAGGRIEEWSLGQQTGFASDGFMLIAEATRTGVTLPTSDFAVNAGEAGVCGFAAASLVRVAILSEGRAVTDPAQREIQLLTQRYSKNQDEAVVRVKLAREQRATL